jgi:hypothetical protein
MKGKSFILVLAILLPVILGSGGGCSTQYSRQINDNRLVEGLYSKGSRPSTTKQVIFRGNEGGFGGDVNVAMADPKVISGVWKCILNSENYGVYSACGYRKIEFYISVDSDIPVGTLILLCGTDDAAYLEGQEPFVWDATKGGRDGLYQCHGLNELVEPYLRDEYNRRQSSSTDGETNLISHPKTNQQGTVRGLQGE